MERSVVQHGPATLMVSLPAEWTKKHSVLKGDKVVVEEKGNSLLVHTSSPGKRTQSTISLNLTTANRQIIRELVGIAYKCGYDIICIKFETLDIFTFIQEQVPELFKGCEIMDSTSTSCVIRQLHIDVPEECDNMVRRMFIIIQEFGSRILTMIEQQKGDRSALEYEYMMNRLCNYCHRLLLKQTNDKEKSPYLYVILWVLEKISDEYAKIVDYICDQKHWPLDPKLVAIFEQITNVYERYYKLFYQYSDESMLEMKRSIKDLKEKSLAINPSHRNDFWISLHNIITKLQESVNSIIGYHC